MADDEDNNSVGIFDSYLPLTAAERENGKIHPCDTRWFANLRKREKYLKSIDDLVFFEEIGEKFLVEIMELPCFDVHNKSELRCGCANELLEHHSRRRIVVKMMVEYHSLTAKEKKQYRLNRVKEVMDRFLVEKSGSDRRKIQMRGKCFILASIYNTNTRKPFCVCRHTYQRIMGIGNKQMGGGKTGIHENKIRNHGTTG